MDCPLFRYRCLDKQLRLANSTIQDIEMIKSMVPAENPIQLEIDKNLQAAKEIRRAVWSDIEIFLDTKIGIDLKWKS